MRSWISLAGAMALVATLVGCGGGGSGGGGGGVFIPQQPPPVSSTPLTLAVAVNGNPAIVGVDGEFAIQTGDIVEVTASQDANWSFGSGGAGPVLLRNPTVNSGSKWSGQIVNLKPEVITYTVTAQAVSDAARTEKVVLKLGAGDERNGPRKVWATNGTQHTLDLNFDIQTYEMIAADRSRSGGDFHPDPAEPGTYIFESPRITASVNTARFRVADDGGVVGAFPFASHQAPGTHAVQPFLAARSVVTTQDGLSGVYVRFALREAEGMRTTDRHAVTISSDGTEMRVCDDGYFTPVHFCSPAELKTYAVSPGASDGTWTATHVDDPADTASFAVAHIAGQPILLEAELGAAASAFTFHVGLRNLVEWPATSIARGGHTEGAWGTLTLLGNFAEPSTLTLAWPDGTSGLTSYEFMRTGDFPPGLALGIGDDGRSYHAARNSALAIVSGGHAVMQFGLVD